MPAPGKEVAIYGHSWGSVLGVLYAARFPQKVAAYVGSGQIGDGPAGEASSYAFALAEAERLHDRKAVEAPRAGGPESSIFDLPNILRGFRFSPDAMWAEVSRLDLVKAVPALQVPVLLLLGRRDHWVPPEASVAFFEALTAPSKRLVWFEGSGHQPFADEPAKFNARMAELARPVVAA